MTSTPLLATLLSFAATFLVLSLLVQVLQEIYKYVTSSKSRSYEQALVDFLGSYATRLLQPGTLPDLHPRSPFQLRGARPAGRIQPMDQETLVVALERAAEPWIRRTLEALRLEAAVQKASTAGPSPALLQFLRDLGQADPHSPGFRVAMELKEFLAAWNVATLRVDASALLLALHQRFLPVVRQTIDGFSQLTRNVEYAYRRRNLRQTFLIGFVVAFLLQFPADRLYQRASQVSLEEAIAAAEQARSLYAGGVPGDTTAARNLTALRSRADTLLVMLGRSPSDHSLESRLTLGRVTAEFGSPRAGAYYLLGCLLTSLLISFGAPFWNDLSGALLRVAKGSSIPVVESPKREET